MAETTILQHREKRRSVRERDKLRSDLATEARMVRLLSGQLRDAESRALERYARSHRLLDVFFRSAGDAIGRMLSKELKPHAERMLASARPRFEPSLTAESSFEMCSTIVDVRIPAMGFRDVIPDFKD